MAAPDKEPPAPPGDFSSVTLKLEKRGVNTFRLVWAQDIGGKRETYKSPWLPRSRIHATVATHRAKWAAFLFGGMGPIPRNVTDHRHTQK